MSTAEIDRLHSFNCRYKQPYENFDDTVWNSKKIDRPAAKTYALKIVGLITNQYIYKSPDIAHAMIELVYTWGNFKRRNADYSHNNELYYLVPFVDRIMNIYDNDVVKTVTAIYYLSNASDLAYTNERLMIVLTELDILFKPKKILEVSERTYIYNNIQIVCLND